MKGPLECDSSEFSISLSNSRYPSRYYQGYLTAHTNVLTRILPATISDITKSTVLFSVFYDDLATTYISETPQDTPSSLLGAIGGNLVTFLNIYYNHLKLHSIMYFFIFRAYS